MDDKELVMRTRNSFRVGKSRAEVLSGFQKRGYKLAYAEKIIEKAQKPRRVLLFSFYIGLVVFLLLVIAYLLINDSRIDASFFPIAGKVGVLDDSSGSEDTLGVGFDGIEITPEFISRILEKVGTEELHGGLFYGEPIINFKVGNQEFFSVIGGEVETYEGLSKDADLQFNAPKEEVVSVVNSNNPKEMFRDSILSGRASVDILAGKPELFAKEYLSLYDSLK
ncbi:MAG: hypothetical protein NUV97_02870 [archaeon]|nr:hypothetical protein [archaeon]MCR4323939.1 hypothetical protein [Nanoarchaeota archaeon]